MTVLHLFLQSQIKQISDPEDNVLVSSTKKTKVSKSVTANKAGRYTYCFSNKISTVSAKSVSFNVNINLKNAVDENSKNLKEFFIEIFN